MIKYMCQSRVEIEHYSVAYFGQRLLLVLCPLQVKVSCKTKHVVHFNVKAGDVIIWEFATKKRDIAFGEGMKSVEGVDYGIL